MLGKYHINNWFRQMSMSMLKSLTESLWHGNQITWSQSIIQQITDYKGMGGHGGHHLHASWCDKIRNIYHLFVIWKNIWPEYTYRNTDNFSPDVCGSVSRALSWKAQDCLFESCQGTCLELWIWCLGMVCARSNALIDVSLSHVMWRSSSLSLAL